MGIKWNNYNSLRDRLETRFNSLAGGTGLHKRLDGVTVFLILAMAAGLFFLCFGTIKFMHRNGAFDDSLVQKVQDERKLNNFWKERSGNPVGDGVYHNHDKKIFISGGNGDFYIYDPSTKLWGKEPSFPPDDKITPVFSQLRSGSGAAKNAHLPDDHSEPDLIWALNDKGGLARRTEGEWSVVIGDRHSFLTQNTTNITAAAVSTNASGKSLLMLGTRDAGIGIYDVESHSWREKLRKIISGKIGAQSGISHVKWCDGRFWIITNQNNIYAVTIEGDGSQEGQVTVKLYNKRIPGPALEKIKDFEADHGHSCLWLLAERDNVDKDPSLETKKCNYLCQITDPSLPPKVLLDEKNIYKDLSNAVIQYMQQQGDVLVLAGEKGIYTYNLKMHSWSREFEKSAFHFLKTPGQNGFYFAYGDRSNAGIGKLRLNGSNVHIVENNIGEPIEQLFYHPDGRCMALTSVGGLSNSLYLVEEEAGGLDVSRIYAGTHTELNHEKFTAAVNLDEDRVLFFSPDGILEHNVRTRGFKDYLKGQENLHETLLADKLFVVPSGGGGLLLKDTLRGADVKWLAPDEIKSGGFNLQPEERMFLPDAKYSTAKKWGGAGNGFSIKTSDLNAIIAFIVGNAPNGFKIVGRKMGNVSGLANLIDVTNTEDRVLFTDGQALHRYDLGKRAWEPEVEVILKEGVEIEGLVDFGGTLLCRTGEGLLSEVVGKQTFALVGGPNSFAYSSGATLDDDELSDVYSANGKFYMAGKNHIWAYDADARQVNDEPWILSAASAIKIIGLDNGEPVSFSKATGSAFRGNKQMEPSQDRVLNMSMDGDHIWTVREGEGFNKYLRADSLGGRGQPRVFFKHPRPLGPAAGASNILDARPAGDSVVCMATDRGLALYYPEARSWVGIENADDLLEPERLFQLGDNVLVLQQDRQFRDGVEIELIELPLPQLDREELAPIKLDAKSLEEAGVETILANVVDELKGRMAYVTESGKVVEYNVNNNPRERVLLQAPKEQGPKSDEIWRVYDQQNNNGEYLFATKDAVWRYDTQNHLWEKFVLNFPGFPEPEAAKINIEFNFGDPVVNVEDKDGIRYVGSLGNDGVDLEQISSPQKRFFTEKAGDLLDVQEDQTEEGDNVWRFVLKDKIKSYHPHERRWRMEDIELGEVFDSVKYSKLRPNNSNIVVIEGSKGKDIKWRIHKAADIDGTIHPPTGEFSEYKLNPNDEVEPPIIDEEASIWRLDKDYQVKCMQYREGERYIDEEIKWPKPFYLDSKKIRSVFSWRDQRPATMQRFRSELELFESVDGLRVFMPSTGKEIELPEEAKKFAGVQEVRSRNQGDQLWIKNKDGYLVLDRKREDDVNGSSFIGIRQIVFDKSNHVWGERSDKDWEIYDPEKERFSDPRGTDAGQKLFVFVREGAPVTGVDQQGYIYCQNPKSPRDPFLKKYPVLLPKEIKPAQIHNIVDDAGKLENWWVLAEGTLYHLLTVNELLILKDPSQLLDPALPGGLPKADEPAENTEVKGLPIEGLPILGIQKKIVLANPVLAVLKDSGGVSIQKGEGIIFYSKQNGIRRSDEYNRNNKYVPIVGKRGFGTPPTILSSEWIIRQKWVRKLGPVREAYDPILSIVIQQFTDKILFERPSERNLYANQNGAVETKAPDREYLEADTPKNQPALNAGWLAWDRVRKEFNVNAIINGIARMKGMPPADLIDEGRLFFEDIGSLISLKRNQHWAANSFGIIEYPNEQLELDGRNISVQFTRIAPPIIGAHGKFVSGKTEYRFKAAPKPFMSLPKISLLKQNDVMFKEDIVAQNVEGHFLDVGKKPREVFHVDGGFKFDNDRRALAYSNVGLLVQSAAGVHPLTKFNEFDPGPGDAAMPGGEGVLVGEANKVYLKVGGDQWHAWNGAGWKKNPSDPSRNRLCVDKPTWKWEMIKNRIKIGLNGGNVHRFDYRLADGKIGFTSDQFIDATAHKGKLFVMTEGFFEAGVTLNQLEKINGPRAKPSDTDTLVNLREHNGDRLIRKLVNAFFEWNPANGQFDALKTNPHEEVLLEQNKRIRFRIRKDQIHKELNMEGLDGGKKWAEFSFSRYGRFPFDFVRSIAVHHDRLYLGTGTGLQVYNQLPPSFNDMETHLTLSGEGGSTLEPVEWVGRPSDSKLRNLDLVVAEYAGTDPKVVETRNGQNYAMCRNPTDATKGRIRAESSMVLWRQDRGEQLSGFYSNEKGGFDFFNPSYEVEINDGRLFHDRINDFIDFEENSFSAWEANGEGRMVTLHKQSRRAGIVGEVVNFHFDDIGEEPFLRVDKAHRLYSGKVVNRNVYLKTDDGFKEFNVNSWKDIDDAEIGDWLEYRYQHKPVLTNNRFRLNLDRNKGFRPQLFEYRKKGANQWKEISWRDSGNTGTSIDLWDKCLIRGRFLWSATKGGLVRFNLDLDRDTEPLEFDHRIDPIIIDYDGQGQQVTDFGMDLTENPLPLRFDGASAFKVDLGGGRDTGVYTKLSPDPFLNRSMVTNHYWTWKLNNITGANPNGEIQGQHRVAGTELKINGGQFLMDQTYSLAMNPFENDRLEVATEDGWFSYVGGRFHVKDLQRPAGYPEAEMQSVRHVGVMLERGKNGTVRILLQNKDGKHFSYSEPEKGERNDEGDRRREYQCEDGFWKYQMVYGAKGGGPERIDVWTSRSAFGKSDRRLELGRFFDDYATGLPAMERDENGQIHYYVPTKAGVFKRDDKFKVIEFDALDEESVKSGAVAVLPVRKPAAASGNELIWIPVDQQAMDFHGEGARLKKLKLSNQSGTAKSIEEGPYELTRVKWETPSGVFWSYFDKEKEEKKSAYIQIGNIPEYRERKASWGGIEDKIYYEVAEGSMRFWTSASSETVPFPGELGKLSNIIPYTSISSNPIKVDIAKFYLIGEGGVFEVDLERLIERLTPGADSAQQRKGFGDSGRPPLPPQAESNRGAKKPEPARGEPQEAVKQPIPPKAFENTLGMSFVPVPGVKVKFCIWETRVKDYAAYATANADVDANWQSPGYPQADTQPVVNVSWNDAQAFCAWLTKKEQAAGKLKSGQRYRLPADAEWSVAVGLGHEPGNTPWEKHQRIEDTYPWGKEWPPPKGAGNYAGSLSVDNFSYTSPVGSFAANAYGIHDLGGNVWEWCEDWNDPVLKEFRALRGGAFSLGNRNGLLSSYRFNYTPDIRYGLNGFRCVLTDASDATSAEAALAAQDRSKLIARGKTLFQTKLCFLCHQTDPAVPAPAGLALKATKFIGDFWGKEREVQINSDPQSPVFKDSGKTQRVKLDEAYFMESVEKPNAKVVKGAIPGMAPLPTTPEERKALAAYVKSLSK